MSASPSAPSPWRSFTEPDAVVLDSHRSGKPAPAGVMLLLASVAVAGTAAYGAMLARHLDALDVARAAGLFTAAAALSWLTPLPATYILNSMAGSRLRLSTTFLAALMTAAWGGLGFFSLVPIAGVLRWAFPDSPWVALVTHLVVFAAVGVCMAALYGRLLSALEPHRSGGRAWWMWLFVLLMVELLYLFGLVRFTTP